MPGIRNGFGIGWSRKFPGAGLLYDPRSVRFSSGGEALNAPSIRRKDNASNMSICQRGSGILCFALRSFLVFETDAKAMASALWSRIHLVLTPSFGLELGRSRLTFDRGQPKRICYIFPLDPY